MRIRTVDEYQAAYKLSVEDPETFWAEIAQEFQWRKPWTKTLQWNFEEPSIKWFVGGKLNITENCLDRHLAERGDQPAIIWEPNDPTETGVTLTYRMLHDQICRFANVLKRNGVVKGDRVCIYMPMVPELAIAVLACARIGAVHSVVFGGFSAQSIADRINDAQCKLIITSDGAYRGNKEIAMKNTVDDALIGCPSVERVIVLTRTRTPVAMLKGRDVWWEQELKQVTADCPAEEMDAEDMLFILYTSGSTGKPKGVVHTCGGYMVYTAYTFQNVFQYEEDQTFFCTADIGWITGHSYIVYGPLASGATSLLFEGIPTYPDAGRFWDITNKHKVNILYTAPTAIRSLMGFGLDYVKGRDLSSLRVLGSVGEPINEEAWHWYDDNIGHNRCPDLVDHTRVEQGGGVAQVGCFSFGNFAQNSAHNFTGARLGQTRHKLDFVGLGNSANYAAYGCQNIAFGQVGVVVVGHLVGNDVGIDTLPLNIMWVAYHRALHYARVHVNGIFYLGRANAVARYVQDVVYPAGNAVIPIFIAQAAVAREVQPRIGGEVCLPAAFMVAVSRAQDAGPRKFQTQVSADAVPLNLVTVFVYQYGLNARQGKGGIGWFGFGNARKG